MFNLVKRASISWIVLHLFWQSAAAQEASPERPPSPVPAVVAPSPPPPADATKPVVPSPQGPLDPLGTVKPGADAPRGTMTVPAPAAKPEGPTLSPIGAPSTTRSLGGPISVPAPSTSTDRRTSSVDIDAQGKAVGQDLDVVKRNAAAPSSNASATFRALKRLSPQEILAASHDVFSIYVLRDSERTLVFDFPNTREQSKMFARLILFIERAGASKTRVMSVPEVQKWLQTNSVQFDTLTVGNNMRTAELARFFNSARFQGEPITVDEQRLYDWLVQSQLLREEEAGVSVIEPERVLVSVPQVSSVPGCNGCTVSTAARAVILQHELSHARFATDTVYQNYVLWFWSNALSLVQRDKFTRFLRSRGYDTAIRELCANEMQAFLMHTPDPSMFAAADIGVSDAELTEMRRRFQEGIAPKPRAMADRPYQFD